MKRFVSVFFAGLLILSLGACHKAGGGQPEKAARAFLAQFYTVDTQTVADFTGGLPLPGLLEGLLDGPFQAQMTERGYRSFETNAYRMRFVSDCQRKGATIAPEDIRLTGKTGGKNRVQFNYAVPISMAGPSGSEPQTIYGQLAVVKQGNLWLIDWFTVQNAPQYVG